MVIFMESFIIPNRTAYNALSSKEKQELTQKIALCTGAAWKKMQTFSLWGQSLETAIYTLKDRNFVFIPGDTVTLGWNGFSDTTHPDFPKFKAALDEDILQYWGGQFQTEEILKHLTTPLRQAVIPPMLVEQEPINFTCSQPVNFEELTLSEQYQQSIEDWKANPRSHQITFDTFQLGNPKLRLTKKKEGSIFAEILIPATVDDLQKHLETQGFTMPNGDQWEYLCGGGCQTLFVWGDNLEFCDEEWEQPNFFGLTIAFDPYAQEIVKDSIWPYRGGDGGVLECYGDLNVLNDLICSPHYIEWDISDETQRMQIQECLEDGLSEDYDCYRRILVLDTQY